MARMTPRESQNVEYKRSWQDEYLKWICGFANAQGAVMYFGVDDDHEVVGVKSVDKLMEDIPNKVINFMGIVVDVNLHEQDGLEYIEVVVKPSSMPISYRGKYYYRTGSTMQELNGSALSDFLMRKMNTTWDASTIPSATLDDIDPVAVKYFLDAAVDAKRLKSTALKEDLETTLRKLHLISDANGQLTIAALLLFGKDIERWDATAAFRIGRFGNSQADLMIQDSISCPLIKMPDEVIDVLRTKYLVSPIHYEGLRRKEPLEIPEEALREIVCNAIVHRQYPGTFIQMKVFANEITLWNGGQLPLNYTIDTLWQPHESHPRNPLIAKVFFLAGFIESWGRGYEKIGEEFTKARLEIPRFEEVRGGFMATIKRERFMAIASGQSDDKPDGSSVVENVVEELSERQRLVLKTLEASVAGNGVETAMSLSQKIGVSQRSVQRDLAILSAKGFIRRVGPDKGGHWAIVK